MPTIYKNDVIHWMKKKYPDNPEYFWDMDKVLEVINDYLTAVEDQRIHKAKVNGFHGLNNNNISAWATDKATDFDGPLDDDSFAELMRYAYEKGRSVPDAVEQYITSMITGEEWSDAYKELPSVARTLLDGMIEEINWTEVAEHYMDDLDFECPICKREDCDGKYDEDDCENKNDKGQAVCPECLSPDCPNADGSADEECEVEEECQHCMEKSCKSLRTNEPLDCPDYDPSNEYIDPSDGMFVDANGVEGQLTVEEILNERMQGLSKAVADLEKENDDDGDRSEE